MKASEAFKMQEDTVEAFCRILKDEYAIELRREQNRQNSNWDGDAYHVWRGQDISIFVSKMALNG